MAESYSFKSGKLPLLVSMPHAGTALPDSMKSRMTEQALSLPDTDWYIPRLYEFVESIGASVIEAAFSRYVVDLNRPAGDQQLYPGQAGTGLCPKETFHGEAVYLPDEEPDAREIENRIQKYWQPYHDRISSELNRLKNEYGYALIYDAHSIRSEIPRLFANRLTDLNIGTANGASCHPALSAAIDRHLRQQGDYSYVIDGRFVGGYITRHYGRPECQIHAIQMEISQRNYMDENNCQYLTDKAGRLQPLLAECIRSLLASPHFSQE